MSVAFVLSGGAGLGAVQVGMLRALAERGVRPDAIVGTSVGAVNGAYVASRGFDREAVDALAEIWRGTRRSRVFPAEPLTGLLGFVGARRNLVPAAALRRLMTQHIEHDLLEELPIPLLVIACDVLGGTEVRLSRGPLVDAVLASAAIPGVFPPIAWEGRPLMDGGIVDNTPIVPALELGAQRVYVLPAAAPCALTTPPRGAIGMLVHATSLLVAQRFATESLVLADTRVTILPPPCPIRVQPTDFGHAGELIARAYDSAAAFLDEKDERVVALSHARRRRRPPVVDSATLPSAG